MVAVPFAEHAVVLRFVADGVAYFISDDSGNRISHIELTATEVEKLLYRGEVLVIEIR